MVEVFRTNVHEPKDAQYLATWLQQQFPGSRINFDLDDCDRILRIEAGQVAVQQVTRLLQQKGFECSVLT